MNMGDFVAPTLAGPLWLVPLLYQRYAVMVPLLYDTCAVIVHILFVP